MSNAITWNEIPWDEGASPEEKMYQFDAQLIENGGKPQRKQEED